MMRVRLVLVLAVGLVGVGSAPGQVCDGISEASAADLTTVRVASGLTRPVLAVSPPGDTERLFIVEQIGRIRILRDGALLPTPFLDIQGIVRAPGDPGAGNEEGLLGLAFHPNFAVNGRFFVYHTVTDSSANVVARYELATADTGDVTSRVEVISIPHPGQENHNGGMIAFGPLDGHLYIAPGDGGGGCDPFDTGQDGADLRAKMLRLDVDVLPYSIPADNPFVGNPGFLDEIWAYGLRNPWRFSFDRLSGDLYIGDVGQNEWEEIDYQPGTSMGGENYGWSAFEGTTCSSISSNCDQVCSAPGHVPPVVEFDHTGGCSVTGGYVYRGCRMPDLHGTYFYSDFCGAFIRTFEIAAGVAVNQDDLTSELAPGGGLTISEVTSFGEDGRGEVYIIDRGVFSGGNGEVFKVVPILPALEVSGTGAEPLRLAPGNWSWEDLEATSMHPIDSYRLYRHDGDGSGTFDCVLETTVTTSGGDPDVPPLDAIYSYLVIALNTAGDETTPGEGSLGMPRTLSAFACP